MAKYKFRMDIKLRGGDELVKKLQAMGKDAPEALQGAARAGGKTLLAGIEQRAPGKGFVMEDAKPNTAQTKSVEFGPDKDHWYYQFFETGVQPFEIDMVRRKSKRSAVDRAKTAKKGKTVLVRGRKIEGDTQALKFDGQFARHVRRGGMVAQPFMRPGYDAKRSDGLDAFGDHIRANAIDKHMESR